MLLKSIELQNFRQFIKEKIDFSTDRDKNVTIIIGENGTGKTTFAQAFFWCFYGETNFSDKSMLNKEVAKKLTPNEIATVKVTVSLVHGEKEYIIIRSQDYKCSLNGKVIVSNTKLDIGPKTQDGVTKYLNPNACEATIKNILPKELSHYFFFDGERIENMSKNIAMGKKNDEFSEAVLGLTGLKATKNAIKHLKPGVMGKFDQMYSEDSSKKILSLTQEINRLQNGLFNIENRLKEIDEEMASAKTSKQKFEKNIREYEDGAKLQDQKENINNQIKALQSYKRNCIKQVVESFNSSIYRFLNLSISQRALKLLQDTDFTEKDIPEMHSKTIEFLLKRGSCICGTSLREGTVPYQLVKDLLDYLPPQSIGVTVGQYVKDTKKLYQEDIQLGEQINGQLEMIYAQDANIEDLEEEINTIQNLLPEDDAKSKVIQINNQIRQCEKMIQNLENQQKRLIFEQGELETKKNLKEARRSELSLLDTNNREIEICKALTGQIHDELKKDYSVKETAVRKELQDSINSIFQSIYDGGLSLSIDEKYNVSVHVNDYIGNVETSTAQSISVIFAFISAIIKMAREKNQHDDSYAEPYPLVMDAPLSAFDKRRIKSVCEALPNTAEQVVIFIKDTDGELAEQYLGHKIEPNFRHRFEKIDEFHTKIM